MKKLLVVGITILLVGISVPSTGISFEKSTTSHNGKTLYVGGYLPGNYSKIQDAINYSSDGDTIFVYNGVYFENLIVNKSINLIGEDLKNTIIDGSNKDIVVFARSNYVNLMGFTIRNSNYIGVFVVDSKFCNISGNIIKNHVNENNVANGVALRNSSYIDCYRNTIENCNTGIFLWHWNNNCSILDNFITNNIYGICLWDVVYCNISKNIISNNTASGIFGSIGHWPNGPNYNKINRNIIKDNEGHGIEIIRGNYNKISLNFITQTNFSISNRDGYSGITIYSGSNNNNISMNTIMNDWAGIIITYSYNNSIYLNTIVKCMYGIIIQNDDNHSFFNTNSKIERTNNVRKNNFLKVLFPAREIFRSIKSDSNSYWVGNYWGRPRILPRVIFGFFKISSISRCWGIPTKYQFDWHPAIKPYII